MKNICIIDNRIGKNLEQDYATVSLWGDPAVIYPLETAVHSGLFEEILLWTNHEESVKAAKERFGDRVRCVEEISQEEMKGNKVCVISGRAVLVTEKMLSDALEQYEGGILVGAKKGACLEDISFADMEAPFYILEAGEDHDKKELYPLPVKNALLVFTKSDYEMALLLTGKAKGGPSLRVPILKRISEKYEDFLNLRQEKNTICLVGHSQLDFWEIKELAGYRVRNCGISGITAAEYDENILQKNFLNCDSGIYVVMHGTNDIVVNDSDEDIFREIEKTIDYIKAHAADPKIYFLACTHVTGNAERENQRITDMNQYVREQLPKDVVWIDLTDLDDESGELRKDYTVDGLHFSDKAYEVIRQKLEDKINADIERKYNA